MKKRKEALPDWGVAVSGRALPPLHVNAEIADDLHTLREIKKPADATSPRALLVISPMVGSMISLTTLGEKKPWAVSKARCSFQSRARCPGRSNVGQTAQHSQQ